MSEHDQGDDLPARIRRSIGENSPFGLQTIVRAKTSKPQTDSPRSCEPWPSRHARNRAIFYTPSAAAKTASPSTSMIGGPRSPRSPSMNKARTFVRPSKNSALSSIRALR